MLLMDRNVLFPAKALTNLACGIWRGTRSRTKFGASDASRLPVGATQPALGRHTEREIPCRISTGTTRLPDAASVRTGQSRSMQGLRAYMIRVYNYMAMGVALTGVVSWLTFNAAVTETRRAAGAHAVRSDDLQRTGDDRAVPRHARAGVLHQLAHRLAAAVDGIHAVHGLCRRCSG